MSAASSLWKNRREIEDKSNGVHVQFHRHSPLLSITNSMHFFQLGHCLLHRQNRFWVEVSLCKREHWTYSCRQSLSWSRSWMQEKKSDYKKKIKMKKWKRKELKSGIDNLPSKIAHTRTKTLEIWFLVWYIINSLVCTEFLAINLQKYIISKFANKNFIITIVFFIVTAFSVELT